MNYLATIGDVRGLVDNLRAAREGVGSGPGSGDTFLKVNDRTGEITFGQEDAPLPGDHRFAVGLHGINHGYVVSTPPPAKVLERHMVPMAQGGPRPTPPGGQYGTYEQGGARDVVELELSSIDEPGFRLTFTAWGSSSANRIGNLLDKAITHLGSADGQAGFVHPVVVVKSGSYQNKKWNKMIHHIEFELVDWLHLDGKTLLSERGATAIGGDGGRAPWDDDDGMSDAEREIFGAAE